MIKKSDEHDINRAGKRLLREALEQLGWVINDVQEDYGIDCNLQVFDRGTPTGAWFHIQLKSSAASDYSSDRAFVSQELPIDHARHYALDMREPVFVIHADVTSKIIYWHAPQLDLQLTATLSKTTARSVTLRVPTRQQLPATATDMLTTLDEIYLVLGSRELMSASTQSFAESLKHLPDQAALHHSFQQKNDTLKLQNIVTLFHQGRFDDARLRAKIIIDDPDAEIDVKFWAEIQLQSIDYRETVHAGKPQEQIPKLLLMHAKNLQKLTASGPKHLKFYSLITRQAAELEVLVHEHGALFMAMTQHLHYTGNPLILVGLYARKSVITRRIVSKYNQCVRLARYAAKYPHRWVLGRALPTIVNAISHFLITLAAEENIETRRAFASSALQICKVAAWINGEVGDSDGMVLAIIGALQTTRSTESDAYRWADHVARSLSDPDARADALVVIERATKRWKGEHVAGDYHGNTIWQIMQNMSTALGIDLSNEDDPLVRELRIAAKDNNPERILITCQHLLVSRGAVGPTARKIEHLFNIGTVGSKVIHCTLHHYHVEGRELDTAYRDIKRLHCDTCPDKKSRPDGWRYTEEVRQDMQTRNREFVAALAGTQFGFRFTDKD